MRSNLEVIKEWYAELTPELLDENVEWVMAEGFPADGTYHGRDEVVEVWLPKLMSHFDEFHRVPTELFDAGDQIISIGNYEGRATATGRAFKVPFAHVW